ncbi:MAG TPA: NAD-binding protein [Candidatus Lustribacter sp.]|nr:NAD-binding protein [Candidatus Lustribacter sp.]
MADVPLILVVGGDALAVRVCEELCSTQGHRVAMVWPHDHELAKQLERIKCEYLPFAPNDYESLRSVGVPDATSLMALAEDDRVNLQVALKARDINPKIRVVLRQFNRTLARKIEQNLPNCSVLSLASHAAATIVGAALDQSAFYSLQFPDLDGVLCGFSERPAGLFGITGMNRAEAQAHLKMRVISVDGKPEYDSARRFEPGDTVVVFGQLRYLIATVVNPVSSEVIDRPKIGRTIRNAIDSFRHLDPIIRTLVAAALTVFVCATIFFSFLFRKDAITAAYFVSTTMTTTGYGDITPTTHLGMAATILLEVLGVAFSGIAIAFVTTALTRAQFNALQGLRQIKARSHVVVCGAGNVGTRVIEFLRMLGQHVVVIDPVPDAETVELSRIREVELLTGDATRDGTLDLCNLQMARALIALTSSDTANLEVALGARGRNPHLQVVMRVQDDAFAGSVGRQFEAIQTFSTSSLSAAAFAGLSRFPGTRSRIEFGDEDYNVGERLQGEVPMPPPAEHCVALAVWRNNQFLHIDTFDEMEPFDRLLFIVPLSQFRAGAPRRETRAAP